jgi:hypothetical protein
VKVRLRYGKVVPLDTPGEGRRPAEILSDLLGARDDIHDFGYMLYLWKLQEEYGFPENLNFWLHESGFLATLKTAVLDDAPRGRLSETIAAFLPRVRYLPNGVIELDEGDIAALAAWSLQELLRHGPVAAAVCPSCGNPWIPDRGGLLCNRPAFGSGESGSLRSTCRELGAKKTYRVKRREELKETALAKKRAARAGYELAKRAEARGELGKPIRELEAPAPVEQPPREPEETERARKRAKKGDKDGSG